MAFPESGNEAEGTGSPAGVVFLLARAASPSVPLMIPGMSLGQELLGEAALGHGGGGGTRAGVRVWDCRELQSSVEKHQELGEEGFLPCAGQFGGLWTRPGLS